MAEPPAAGSRRLRAGRAALFQALALVAPGFLFGIHLGGLLFYLNPDLPLTLGAVTRTAFAYGLAGGLASGSLGLLFLRRRRPGRAFRILPWGLTGAFVGAAILDSAHASYYAYYLPAGINERLIKTALWLSLAALIAFYTALLHSLQSRPYGVRSRLAYWLLAIGSIVAMIERRAAFVPQADLLRPIEIGEQRLAGLILVGIDSATLDALLPMAEEGRVPFLAEMLRAGAYGRLSGFEPARPSALWTTLATGKYPYKHGVLGGAVYRTDLVARGSMLRLLPVGIGFRRWGLPDSRARREDPVAARRVQALWELFPDLGVISAVVGWPGATLDPPGSQFVFAEDFFGGAYASAAATPEPFAERGWIFRLGRDEVEPALRTAAGVEAPDALLDALASDAWRAGVARLLEREGQARALFVRLPGLATASSRFFGGYSGLRFEARHTPEYESAAALLAAYYSQVDQLVGELWAQMPEPKLLAVVSPSGVELPSLAARAWLAARGHGTMTGRLSGAPDGVLLLRGQGVRAETLVTGAQAVDVVPTLLYGLGLPVARDLDGRVLTEVFDRDFLEANPLTFVPSYEALAAEGP